MCGIIGVFVKDSTKIAERLALIYENQRERGRDGAGYAIRQPDGSMHRCRFRNPSKALKFLAEENLQVGTLVMFHHRISTSTPNLPAFNHPISNEVGDMYLIHNGHISNYASLFSKYGREHQFETILGDEESKKWQITDSEVLIHSFEEKQPQNGIELAVKALAEECEGSYAVAFMLKAESRILLLRNFNPLTIFSDADGNIWFASVLPKGKGFTAISELGDGEFGWLGSEYSKLGEIQKFKEKPEPKRYYYYGDDYHTADFSSEFGSEFESAHTRKYCKLCGEETLDGHKYCEWCWSQIQDREHR